MIMNGRSVVTFMSGWINTQVVNKADMRLFGAYVVEGPILRTLTSRG